jgi:hypothetical protein
MRDVARGQTIEKSENVLAAFASHQHTDLEKVDWKCKYRLLDELIVFSLSRRADT